MRARLASVAPLIAACLLPHTLPHAAAQCIPHWEVLPGVNGQINDLAVFDDGTGPAIFAAGEFTTAGGQTARRIAKWDGSEWSPLIGPDGEGLFANFPATALATKLAVFDDGSGPALYVGGFINLAGGVPVTSLARWTGAAWESLPPIPGSSATPLILALEVFDDGSGPALYAGGSFHSGGAGATNNIARWDGIGWTPLIGSHGTGTNDVINALETYDDGNGPALYVGGNFTIAGGIAANRIARWDGNTFSPLFAPGGNGLTSNVESLIAISGPLDNPPSLYIGGLFATAGGVTVNRITRWDGHNFSQLAGPIATGIGGNASVLAITAYDEGTNTGPSLFIGGFFDTAGGTTVNGITRWNGQYFSPLVGSTGIGLNGNANALLVFDDGHGPALYAGGSFTTAAGQPAARFARWKGCPIPTPTNCPGDLNGDGIVNAADLSIVLNTFGTMCP